MLNAISFVKIFHIDLQMYNKQFINTTVNISVCVYVCEFQ